MSTGDRVRTDGAAAVLQVIARAAADLQGVRALPDAIAATAVAALEVTGALEAAVVTAPGGDWSRGHRAVARPEGTAVDAPPGPAAFQRRALDSCGAIRAATRVTAPDGTTRRDPVVAVPLLGRRGERLGVVHARRPSAPGGPAAHEEALMIVAALGGAAIARLRLEERAHRLERTEAVGRLATGLAHDIRNVLTTILGATDNALARPHEVPAPLRGDLGTIRAAAGAGADITRRLLSVARSRGRAARPIDLDAALAASTRMLEILAGPRVEVRVQRTPGLPPVEIVPGALEQALANLVANARDAMPDGGRLRLRTSMVQTRGGPAGLPPAGRYVRLSVRDSGAGMDDATRRRALEPFFTTKPPGEGTGLGLSSVAEDVRAAGGDVVVSSVPGRGTTVHLLLPAVERPAPARPARPVGGGETIAVVEDDERLRVVICEMLQTLGYRVVAGGSAAEVRAAAEGAPLELLLADCRLDGAGGPEVARELRRADPGLPVLYMSGYDRELALGERQERRALFLEKPFDAAVLAEHVRDALDLRA